MSFMVKDDSALVKYSEIWNKIKELIDKKAHSEVIYHDKYIKTKIKAFNPVVHTNFHSKRLQKKIHITFVWRQ